MEILWKGIVTTKFRANRRVSTVPFHKVSTPGNYVKLRYFTQCTLKWFKKYSENLLENFIIVFNHSKGSLERHLNLCAFLVSEFVTNVCLLSLKLIFTRLSSCRNVINLKQNFYLFCYTAVNQKVLITAVLTNKRMFQ